MFFTLKDYKFKHWWSNFLVYSCSKNLNIFCTVNWYLLFMECSVYSTWFNMHPNFLTNSSLLRYLINYGLDFMRYFEILYHKIKHRLERFCFGLIFKKYAYLRLFSFNDTWLKSMLIINKLPIESKYFWTLKLSFIECVCLYVFMCYLFCCCCCLSGPGCNINSSPGLQYSTGSRVKGGQGEEK